jgi:hypothetical protein
LNVADLFRQAAILRPLNQKLGVSVEAAALEVDSLGRAAVEESPLPRGTDDGVTSDGRTSGAWLCGFSRDHKPGLRTSLAECHVLEVGAGFEADGAD